MLVEIIYDFVTLNAMDKFEISAPDYLEKDSGKCVGCPISFWLHCLYFFIWSGGSQGNAELYNPDHERMLLQLETHANYVVDQI